MSEKIAVVTGASRGIGRAIACRLASEGIRVIINYNGSVEQAEQDHGDSGLPGPPVGCEKFP